MQLANNRLSIDVLQAVGILKALNWNTDGKMCFACLSAIVNHLLKLQLNEEREGLC